jgi:hypothetical protein
VFVPLCWIEINAEVQKRIQLVRKDGSRQSKKRKHAEVTPSPFRDSELCNPPAWVVYYSSAKESDEETDDQFISSLAASSSYFSPEMEALFGNDGNNDMEGDEVIDGRVNLMGSMDCA